jgi:hypothetical protein
MRADIHDGREQKRSIHGPDTEAQDPLGLIESLAIASVSSGYKDVITMVILILIMILMPQGLLGRRGRLGG